MTSELFTADDNKILDITGCLSKCDKYVYDAHLEGLSDPLNNDTLFISLAISSGEYELREQVIYSMEITFIAAFSIVFFLVYYIRL